MGNGATTDAVPSSPHPTRWFELAPDWVCEILSPTTAKIDRTLKMPLYARHAVAWLWLIDPLLSTLEAYRLRDGRWSLEVTLKDDDRVAVDPFAAVAFPLADLWA